MEYEKDIPYEELMEKCGIIHSENPKKVIECISNLSDIYKKEQILSIYNYFFEHADSYEVLAYLLENINKYKSESSIELLIDSLLMKEKMYERIQDSEKLTRLRVNIAKTLGNTKDSKAVYPLLYCLNNKEENYKVKLSCAEALGKIGNRYAVVPLINIVEDENESSIYVKESAVSALGMLGDIQAVDSLVSILESKSSFLNKFTFLKERALEALNKLGFKGEKVFHAVEKSLNDESPQIRINAIEVLMNSNDSRAVELIQNMLYDSDYEVVKNAVIALYNCSKENILDKIINDPQMNDNARIAAISIKESLTDSKEDETNE